MSDRTIDGFMQAFYLTLAVGIISVALLVEDADKLLWVGIPLVLIALLGYNNDHYDREGMRIPPYDR